MLCRISNNIGNAQNPDAENIHHEMEPIPEENDDVAEMLKSVDGLLEQMKPDNSEEENKDDPVDVHVSYDEKENEGNILENIIKPKYLSCYSW